MKLFRLSEWTIEQTVRTSIVAITSTAVLLTAYLFWTFTKDAGEQTLHELTAISTEAAQRQLTEAVQRRVLEFQGIAGSNVIATALTDSSGREGYLAPFLEQRTRATGLSFALYDYRGRLLIRTGERSEPIGAPLMTMDPANAVVRDLDFRVSGSRIDLEAPIRFYADKKPIGYLVGAIKTETFSEDITLVPSKFYSVAVRFYGTQSFMKQPLDVKIVETPDAVLAARLELTPQSSWIDEAQRKITILGLGATAAILALGVVVARLTARLISSPIADLTQAVKKLRSGEKVSRPHSDMPVEIETLSSALFVAFEERGAALEKLQSLANFDTLTGALSRSYFDHRARNMLQIALRSGEPATLLYIDLDRFKDINDNHGHDAGDLVLKSVVSRVQARLRTIDLLGRRGGDEFVVFLPGLDDHGDIGALAFDLARLITIPVKVGEGARVEVGVSMGAATFPFDAESYEQLMTCADEAMYQAKKMGR